MTFPEHILRDTGYIQLGEDEIMREADFIEWEPNSFTKIDERSLHIGRRVSTLPKIMESTIVGSVLTRSRSAKVFRSK